MRAPAGSGLERGDLVVAMVRHPDPVPCPSCGAGDWDMCRNGGYTEHGLGVDVGTLNRSIVLENDVVFGSVNANRRHYEVAAAALARAQIERGSSGSSPAAWRSRAGEKRSRSVTTT